MTSLRKQAKAPGATAAVGRLKRESAPAKRQSTASALRLVTPNRNKRAAAPRVVVGASSEGVAREKGGIQSVERALAILAEIAAHPDGIRLVELSGSVGLRNSTTFHLIKTMVTLGYVEKVKDGKRYRIGRRLFTLAAGALDEIG